MDKIALEQELTAAYEKLAEAEEKIIRLTKAVNTQHKVEGVLIAAGFITREKVREAEDILIALDG